MTSADAHVSDSGDRQCPPANHSGRESGLQLQRLLHLVYTHNPFYVISAALVFSGLRMSFDASGETFATSALMIGLTGYTLVFACMSLLLIRKGQVWDDVRSLLLLIVLMLLAIPVTFDDALVANPSRGATYYLLGLLFSITVSEVLLRGLRIKLPGWYRVAYYALLGLFYLYPLGISVLATDPDSPTIQWALFGFSSVAAMAVLLLLPAIRRGIQYVADNGTPWAWPLFPWTLYAVLIFGIAARSYYLCVSFHFVVGSGTIFGWYFLVPLLMAVNALFLERALATRSQLLERIVLLVPMALVGVAMCGHSTNAIYIRFLEMFTDRIGAAPPWVTLVMAVLFYGFATARGLRGGSEALAAGIAAFAVIGPTTLSPATFTPWNFLPVLVAGGLFLISSIQRGDSRLALLSAACLILTWVQEVPRFHEHLLYLHAFFSLAAVLLIGAVFHDPFSKVVRNVGAGLLLVISFMLAIEDPTLTGELPRHVTLLGPLLLALVAFSYCRIVRNRLYKLAAISSLAIWALVNGAYVYESLRELVPGLDLLAAGTLFFIVAAGISLFKAGLVPKHRLFRKA